MSEILLYRPYKTEMGAIVVLLIFSLAIMILGAIVSIATITSFVAFGLILMGFEFYLNICKVIAFGENEIQTFGYKVKRKYLWSQFSKAYVGTNFKGWSFMILSPEELTEKEVRRYFNKFSFRGRLKNTNVLVFPVVVDAREVIEFVKTKLPVKDFSPII